MSDIVKDCYDGGTCRNEEFVEELQARLAQQNTESALLAEWRALLDARNKIRKQRAIALGMSTDDIDKHPVSAGRVGILVADDQLARDYQSATAKIVAIKYKLFDDFMV